MKSFLAYARKNIVFLGLLGALLCITVFFAVYLIMNQPKESNDPVITPPPVVEEDSDPAINSFEGNYGKDAQVTLSWSIDAGTEDIKSIKLFQGERQLGGDMKDLTSYSFAQNLYQFPTGDVKFTINVELSNEEIMSQDASVFIRYVLNISMKEEKSEDGIILKLSYQYDKNNPVAVPRIKILNNQTAQPFEFTYQDTKTETNGSLESAVTSYKIGTSKVASGTYELSVRWIFDGLNTSKDFPVTITK